MRHGVTRSSILLFVSALALLGGSPFPGGCGSTLTQSVTTVTETCDIAPNGKPPPGCPSLPPASTCESASSTGKDAPTGCPDGEGQTSPDCSNPKFPLDCGDGYCCPSAFPYCCANSAWCGKTAADCTEVDTPKPLPTVNTGGSSGGRSSGGTSSSGGSGGGTPASCNNCPGLENQCASCGACQAVCYCEAACLCNCSGDSACEQQNRASAQSLGTTCSY